MGTRKETYYHVYSNGLIGRPKRIHNARKIARANETYIIQKVTIRKRRGGKNHFEIIERK